MPSHPLSARKTRDAARAAVTATNAQADALQRIAQQFDARCEFLAGQIASVNDRAGRTFTDDRAKFIERGFFGRLKFLVLGR